MVDLKKRLARGRLNEAVRDGKLPRARTLACVDCGEPAREYDHLHGYDDEHALDVEAVCRPCHVKRGVARGEWPRGDASWQRRRPELVARGERSPTAKLRVADVLAIRAAAARGERHVDIAARHGVARTQIGRIVNHQRWAHVAAQEA